MLASLLLLLWPVEFMSSDDVSKWKSGYVFIIELRI